MCHGLLYPRHPRSRPWTLPWLGSPENPHDRQRRKLLSDLAVPALAQWTTPSSTPRPLQQLTVFFSYSPSRIFAASESRRILHLPRQSDGGIDVRLHHIAVVLVIHICRQK